MQIGIGLPGTIPGVTGSDLIAWARRADAGPFSSLSSIDRLVNFCQERLIPEFDDPKMNLRVFKDKYEQLIDRLILNNQDIEENDVNIYNFRSLINLFSLRNSPVHCNNFNFD